MLFDLYRFIIIYWHATFFWKLDKNIKSGVN